MHFTEDMFEQAVIELFENMGYTHIYAPDMERDYSSPLLDAVLMDSLVKLNKGLPLDAINEAIGKLRNFDTGSLLQKNMQFMDYLQNGIPIRYFVKGEERISIVYLIDYKTVANRIQRNEISIDELFDAICRLEIISIQLNQDDNPQLIFESLNSTGLALSEGDKIRNFILMGLPTKQQEDYYEKYWNRI